MTDGIFLQGRLEMSSSPIEVEEALPLWGEITSNQILVASSVILLIFALKDIFKLMPSLFYMLRQKHGSQALEYNISISKIRNLTAFICIIPFCLIADKYGLYDADFLKLVPLEWRSCVHIGIFCNFLILRRILNGSIRPRRMHSEDMACFIHSPYNYFILLVFSLIISTLLLSFFKIETAAIRSLIWVETGLFYLFSLIRSRQILRSYCGGLATILYLCALEILPVMVLAVSAVVF